MKQRLYIDTSVFHGFYDEEFEEFTRPLLTGYRKRSLSFYFSTVTQDELENAQQVWELVRHLKAEFTELIELISKSINNDNGQEYYYH